MMKALPNTSFLPVPKSAPAGHTTAAAHLLWQVFPRYPCLEYKDNSGQSCSVRYTWTASFGRGLMFWQKWFNLTPQFVAYQLSGHLLHPHWYFTAYSSICQVLLGALSQPIKQTLVVTSGGEEALNILSDLLGQCGKIGSNLNQLARYFNSGGKDSEQIRAQLLTELSALTLFRLDAEKKMGELYGNHQAYKLEELRSNSA